MSGIATFETRFVRVVLVTADLWNIAPSHNSLTLPPPPSLPLAGGFVTSYAVLQLGLPEATGQLIASAYWASIMAGRFAAIYVSTIVKPGPYLAVSVVGSIAAALVLLLFAPYSEMVLWIGTLAFGTAMACIFPTAIGE